MARKSDKKHKVPTAGRVLPDGSLVELVFDANANRTALCFSKAGESSTEEKIDVETGEQLVPVSADNALIKHSAVLLPERPEDYGTNEDLRSDLQSHIHRYVDLDPVFEAIAAHYVLLSWVYDRFNEIPYLRLRGDYGTGKTRALLIIGSLLYRPFFASGASTVSPIFHSLNMFRGSLVLDEADFRFSDEKSDLVKILNNGTVRGMPVLRTMLNRQREFTPMAFQVFGPKIVATRMTFEDVALESRFLTELMGTRRVRSDIPINLPDAANEEAASLRNKLLMYRLQNWHRTGLNTDAGAPELEPRRNQILAPLLSVVFDKELRDAIYERVRSDQQSARTSRGLLIEAHVTEALIARMDVSPKRPLPLKDIVSTVNARYGREYDRPLTHRYIGSVLRSKLCVQAYKSNGVFVVPTNEFPKIANLAERYGLGTEIGDVGT